MSILGFLRNVAVQKVNYLEVRPLIYVHSFLEL